MAVRRTIHDTVCHGHLFCRRGPFVQQRCVRHIHTGEVHHHRLEIQQRFQPALRDLRLVRRVLRVPTRVFENIALNNGGSDGAVVSETEIRRSNDILVCDAPHMTDKAMFAHSVAQVHRRCASDRCRNGLFDQSLKARHADDVEHLLKLFRSGPYMPLLEFSGDAIVGTVHGTFDIGGSVERGNSLWIFSRAWAAAACSASFLLRPEPMPYGSDPKVTSIVKRRSCSGPSSFRTL